MTKLDRQTGDEPDHERLLMSAEDSQFYFLGKDIFWRFYKKGAVFQSQV